MELNSGMHDEFMISLNSDHFIYLKGKYYIDKEMMYYVSSAKTYAIDYHQSCSMPIKRELPLDELKGTIDAVDPNFIIHSMNPQLLEKFAESSVMEKMMKAQEMDEVFKQIKLFLILTFACSVIHLIIYLNDSGALNSIL